VSEVDLLQTKVTLTHSLASNASSAAGDQLNRSATEGNVAHGDLVSGTTNGKPISQSTPVDFSSIVAEYIAMTLFVVIGCGSAMGIAKEEGSAWVLQVSLTFGLAITSLAYAVGHYSGGQINCAVTLGLVLTGKCTVAQGALNFVGQMLGSLTGAFVLLLMYPVKQDKTGQLASNAISDGFQWSHAFIGEFMMTFLLVFVVLESATNPMSAANRSMACMAIGLSVFLAHSVLIPIDGCSINPTRSFGPAVIARLFKHKLVNKKAEPFKHMWIWWAAPLLGAAAASGVSAALMK